MSDNNAFALALNMILPLLVGIATVEKRRALKVLAGAMAVLSTMTIFFTFSRGGLLTLAVVVPLLVWRSRRRLAVGGLIALGLAAFFLLTSEAFLKDYGERASTISSYEQDSSAVGRLNAWQTSWRVFLDHPWTGVGPDNLQVVHRSYSPEPERFRVSHNAYLQILCESGLPALLLFLAALGAAYVSLGRLRRLTGLPWVETHARMLQISLIAYGVGSMFLNTAYAELIYQLVGMSVSLEVIARGAAAAPAPLATEEPWWRRPAATPAPAALARRA
jgi:probable O-glycosylation ligase (exosortase A-associated)